MHKKIVVVVFTCVFMGFVPIACIDQCDGPCGCNPVFENQDFSVAKMGIETLFRSDNNQPVEAERFYFHEALYKAFFVSDLRQVEKLSAQKDYAFISASTACGTPNSFSVETLKGLRIINRSDVQINETLTLKAGEVINEHFNLTLNYQNVYPISNFLITNHRFQIGERLNLKFIRNPLEDITLIFDVEIELVDDRVFEFRNERMRIKGN